MAVVAYNDWLRNLLMNVECVLAFDTAADFLGLTNGGFRSVTQIFVNKKQNIEGTEQILVPSLEELECEVYNGLLCTTVNRTIIDLLEQNGDEQISRVSGERKSAGFRSVNEKGEKMNFHTEFAGQMCVQARLLDPCATNLKFYQRCAVIEKKFQ